MYTSRTKSVTIEVRNKKIHHQKNKKDKSGDFNENNVDSDKMLHNMLDILSPILSKSKHVSIEKQVL